MPNIPQKEPLRHDNVSSSRAAMDRSFAPMLYRDMLFIHILFPNFMFLARQQASFRRRRHDNRDEISKRYAAKAVCACLCFTVCIHNSFLRDDAINDEVKCSPPFLPNSFRGIQQSRDRSSRASRKKREKITGLMTRTWRNPFNVKRQSRIERFVTDCLL